MIACRTDIAEGRYRHSIAKMAIRRRRPQRLLVTGGTGFLGHHLVSGPATEGWEVVAPGSNALDLRDRRDVWTTVHDWKPTAIIHTAYRKGDRASIVDATQHVVDAAVSVGARVVHVSTDALFAGRDDAYTERDAPSPIHDYGHDKADAEEVVANGDPSAITVRTSLIYGTDRLSGHELAVRDALFGRSDMRFFTDEIRSPVLVGDLASALVDLARSTDITGTLHLGGPDSLSRAELARITAERHGWDARGLRLSTIAESGLSRPSRVVLDSGLAMSFGLGVRGPTAWL